MFGLHILCDLKAILDFKERTVKMGDQYQDSRCKSSGFRHWHSQCIKTFES